MTGESKGWVVSGSRSLKTVAALAMTLLTGLGLSSAAMAVTTTLPVEFSEGETQSPPDSTELPKCGQMNPQAPALGATDNPQITKIEGGGKKYSYALPGLPADEYMTVNEPPAGFDPLKASDSELELWGFPPRPENQAGMEGWRELVGPYEAASFQPGCQGTEASNGFYQGEAEQPAWSGYVENAMGEHKKFRTAVGGFYQPFEVNGICGPEAAVSSWVGLGGWGTGFLQTGTEALANGLYNPSSYRVFVEIYAGTWANRYVVPGANLGPNQFERVYVGYDYNSETAYFYDINEYTGQTILTEDHLNHYFYDGQTAEWIEEAPAMSSNVNAPQHPLLDFGAYMTWYFAQYQTQDYAMHPLNGYNYFKAFATHGHGAYQWPGAVWGNENFSDFFYGCA
jgi:Peptidase A4 family